jgi:hypothetical protein
MLATTQLRVAGPSRGRRGILRSQQAERSVAVSSIRRRLGVVKGQVFSLLGHLETLGPGILQVNFDLKTFLPKMPPFLKKISMFAQKMLQHNELEILKNVLTYDVLLISFLRMRTISCKFHDVIHG